MNDDSKFGRNQSESNGPSQPRDRGISRYRSKCELFKKVEEIKKKMEKVEQVELSVGKILQMLKKSCRKLV